MRYVRIWTSSACTLIFWRYCHDLGVCDYRRCTDWILYSLTTCIHHSELHFTHHWHTQTSFLSLLQSPLAVFWQLRLTQCRFLSFPHSGPLLTSARTELLSTANSTNWIPGFRQFHAILLVLSTGADFQPTTSYFTSLHSAELLTTPTSNCFVASNCSCL
jgi:hypothetical protein